MYQTEVSPAFQKKARSFQSWNATTAECYNHKLICNNCPNKQSCQTKVIHRNPYHIQNIKYAVLMTYANIGENGIDRYCTKLAKS